jgi:hypothetical protein
MLECGQDVDELLRAVGRGRIDYFQGLGSEVSCGCGMFREQYSPFRKKYGDLARISITPDTVHPAHGAAIVEVESGDGALLSMKWWRHERPCRYTSLDS